MNTDYWVIVVGAVCMVAALYLVTENWAANNRVKELEAQVRTLKQAYEALWDMTTTRIDLLAQQCGWEWRGPGYRKKEEEE